MAPGNKPGVRLDGQCIAYNQRRPQPPGGKPACVREEMHPIWKTKLCVIRPHAGLDYTLWFEPSNKFRVRPKLVRPNFDYSKVTLPKVPAAGFILHVKDGYLNDGDRRWGGIVFDKENSYVYHEDFLAQQMVPHENAKVKEEMEALVVLHMPWDNWQHATFDLLPRVNFALDLITNVVPHAKIYTGRSWMSYGEQLGIDPKRMLYTSSDTSILYKAKHLYVVDWFGRPTTDSMNPHASFEHITPLLSLANTGNVVNNKNIVYMGRAHSRHVANEQELLQAIRQKLQPGYRLTVFKPSEGPDAKRQHPESVSWGWKEDREVFKDAALVFGPHGGAFSNLVFAPKGCYVMEMGPHYYFRAVSQRSHSPGVNGRWVFFGITSAMDQKHYYVEPEGLPALDDVAETCGWFKTPPKFLSKDIVAGEGCGTSELNGLLAKVQTVPSKDRATYLGEVLHFRQRCSQKCTQRLHCFPWDDHSGFSFKVDVGKVLESMRDMGIVN